MSCYDLTLSGVSVEYGHVIHGCCSGFSFDEVVFHPFAYFSSQRPTSAHLTMTEVAASAAATVPSLSHSLPSRSPAPSPPHFTSTDLTTINSMSTQLTVTDSMKDLVQNSEASEEASTKKTKKIIRKKRRPARPQVDASTMKSEPPPQSGTTWNLWYNKWSGGDTEDKYLSKTAAAGRCTVSRDSGYTRGDKEAGSCYFCVFFAKGLCWKGQECEYLHRLPGIFDTFNPNVDCFGRDKHSDYRDDMGGVGSKSFVPNQTLNI